MMMTLFEEEQIMKAYTKDIMEQGVEQGIERGIEQGIEQGIELSIKKLLEKKFSREDIAKILELELEYVKKLKVI